jgi:hypothetical protein
MPRATRKKSERQKRAKNKVYAVCPRRLPIERDTSRACRLVFPNHRGKGSPQQYAATLTAPRHPIRLKPFQRTFGCLGAKRLKFPGQRSLPATISIVLASVRLTNYRPKRVDLATSTRTSPFIVILRSALEEWSYENKIARILSSVAEERVVGRKPTAGTPARLLCTCVEGGTLH